MQIEKISTGSLHKAAELVRSGRLVAFPTETVYGLGANALNDKAVAEIFAVKGRPHFNPLILHVDGVAMARRHVVWNAWAERLSQAFWPGPMTLVLRRSIPSEVSLLMSAGGDTLAVRMPAHEVARALITAAGVPLAGPSANRSGRVSPTSARHVQDELAGTVPLILDGGACRVGIESTVVDISSEAPVLLRSGAVTQVQLEAALGCDIALPAASSGPLKSPGQLLKHYAPSLPVKLNVLRPLPQEALLAFGPDVPAGAGRILNLSVEGNLTEAAANLFAGLRALDSEAFTAIAVMPIPYEGLGIAINDRLARASMR